METTKVQCCSCDKHHYIHNTAKLNTPGLMKDFYICNNCLAGLPALKPEMISLPESIGIKQNAA